MKKTALITMGVAGAAAVIIGTVSTGNGFIKEGFIASVSGIIADAHPTEEAQTVTESAVDQEVQNRGEAIIAGADALVSPGSDMENEETAGDAVSYEMPVSDPIAVTDESETTYLQTPVSYENSRPSEEMVLPAITDTVIPSAKKVTVAAEMPAESVTVKKPVRQPVVVPSKEVVDLPEESEAPEAPAEQEEDMCEPEARMGCASMGILLYSETGEEIGSMGTCFVCQERDVFDSDGNLIYSVSGDDYLSFTKEDAIAMLSGRYAEENLLDHQEIEEAEIIEDNEDKDYPEDPDEDGVIEKLGCASTEDGVYSDDGELIGVINRCEVCGTEDYHVIEDCCDTDNENTDFEEPDEEAGEEISEF